MRIVNLKYFVLVFLFSLTFASGNAQDLELYGSFKAALVDDLCVDTNGDGVPDATADLNGDKKIFLNEALAATNLYIHDKTISNLDKISFFENLEYLDCGKNLLGGTLDISNLTKLKIFICNNDGLDNLILPSPGLLETIDVHSNWLDEIDLTGLPNLLKVDLWSNELLEIDLSNNDLLSFLDVRSNRLDDILVSSLLNLEYLDVSNNRITSIDITNLLLLDSLDCASNDLTVLDLSMNDLINYLDISSNDLNVIQVGNLTELKSFNCYGNNFITLDLASNLNLVYLQCGGNELNALDLLNQTVLTELLCYDNLISTLDVNHLRDLKKLSCYDNLLDLLNVSSLVHLEHLDCSRNNIDVFDARLLAQMRTMRVGGNSMSELFVQGLDSLEQLICNSNDLTTLNLFGLNMLDELNLSDNEFETIDLENLNNLTSVDLSENLIRTFKFPTLPSLESVHIDYNLLETLDVENLRRLTFLRCDYNELIYLNLEQNIRLERLFARDNQLKYLNLKNGSNFNPSYFSIQNNSTLRHICCDDSELEALLEELTNPDFDSCAVSSYCSFEPGGETYAIVGKVIYDENINGCDSLDDLVPMQKFELSRFTKRDIFIADNTGSVNIVLKDKGRTFKPIMEQADEFLVTPDSLYISFLLDTNLIQQDFCIVAVEPFLDLSITVIPLFGQARPGFTSKYRISYVNQGSNTVSGMVNFEFDSQLLTFRAASPTEDVAQSDLLTWNFVDLKPFDNRTIDVEFRVNSPADNPPINGGDVLSLKGIVLPMDSDLTPENNSFILNQTVVNSYDPNDKTCLQGRTIKSEMIGEYVHYIIRFENTGTADAINIVVKDIIDTDRFDITSLIPLDGSHNFNTRIRDANVVEFIFEHINLPFDDENNDGYVTFKIKSLPTLALGDTLINEAEIYFDFNFPIVTEPSETLISDEIGVDDILSAEGHVLIYPNPAKEVLFLESEEGIKTVDVLNVDGSVLRRVNSLGNPSTISLDLKNLAAGIYFVKIKTEQGVYIQRVVVE